MRHTVAGGGWRRLARRWAEGAALGVALLAPVPVGGDPSPAPGGGVVLVIVAHPDDWQLFLGEAVVEALRRGERVVAVVASAGGDDRPASFWRAREAGAVASMGAALALASEGAALTPSSSPSASAAAPRCRAVPLTGPRVGRGSLAFSAVPTLCEAPGGRMATLFLRLPDGRGDGSGFAPTGHQSLSRLEGGRIARLVAVDGRSAYPSTGAVGDAVVGVLEELGVSVAPRVAGGRWRVVGVWTHDPEVRFNPLDHADHRVVGRVALAVARRVGAPATVYAGYSNVKRGDNLTAREAAAKAWLFVTYDRAMLAANGRWSAYAENAWAHAAYLGRSYGRVWGPVGPPGGGPRAR
jgi:hypothetical protein